MALTALFLLSQSAIAADPNDQTPFSLYGTHIQNFHANDLNRDYLLYISLPRDYEKHSESYPIVFVLDADYCFPLVHDIAWFLADHDELRPLIIVGVAYPGVAQEKYGPIHKLNRTRDYTPTHVAAGGYGPEFQKQSGGADRYLDLLQKELIPTLEKGFRVTHDRTIVGYSYGGLLASYALLTRPALFQRYIIVSPSLWYDNHMISHLQNKTLQAGNNLQGRAFFSVGGDETSAHGDKGMVEDLDSFVKTLAQRKDPHFHYELWTAPGETHHSVFPGAAMRGLKYVFSTSSPKKTSL